MKVLVTGGSGFIGSFLCEKLACIGFEVFNLDVKAPARDVKANFINASILDINQLNDAFIKVKPDVVFHLAAKADVFGENLSDYDVNSIGTENVLNACKLTDTVRHLLFTSTQLVNKPGVIDYDGSLYAPLDELYSRSKVNAEKLIRSSEVDFKWTIFRPTNIWGPYHPRFPTQIWRYIEKGWYIHPDLEIIRSYGYVENIVEQMVAALEVSSALVDRQTFYVGDKSFDSALWVDEFSLKLRNKKAKRFSVKFLKFLATIGESIKKIGLPSPLYLDRYKSMTSHYIIPMERTFEVLGEGSFNLQAGVEKTVKHLKMDGK